MPNSHPVVALITDFGLSDHYAATMKGVMLSLEPALNIVDITHDVEPQNVSRAAYLLWASYRYFPAKTVFTCVVDPGVGTQREFLIAISDHHTFIAPHNGILDYVLWAEGINAVTVLDRDTPKSRSVFSKDVSNTFHGRDLFAPLSAHIAKGVEPRLFGSPHTVDWTNPPFVDSRHPEVKARILDIDRFGNIITNIMQVPSVQGSEVKGIRLGSTIITRWITNYESAPQNVACLIWGSSGLLEIVMRRESAAKALKAKHLVELDLIRP